MADSKISALSAVTSLAGTEEFVAAVTGVSNKITAANLLKAAIPQVSVVSRTAGDLTTSSTSFVDATGLTTTITTGAHRCLVFFTGSGNAAFAANISVDLAIDGTRQGQTYGLVIGQSGPSQTDNENLSFVFLTSALSAASHTLKIQWRTDGGTATLFASTTITPAILTVIELPI